MVVIVVGLALLKYYFDWSIFDAIHSEQGRNTIVYMKDVLSTAWMYIKTPIAFAWEKMLGLLPAAFNFYESH